MDQRLTAAEHRLDALEDAPEGNGNGNGRYESSELVNVRDLIRVEGKVDHIISAVFGNPLDDSDHGLLGEMRHTRESVGKKLDTLFTAVLGLAGVLVVAAVTVAVAAH